MRAVELVQHLLEAIEREVEILGRDHQRRRQADHGAWVSFDSTPFASSRSQTVARARDVGVDLGSGPQAAPAHLRD